MTSYVAMTRLFWFLERKNAYNLFKQILTMSNQVYDMVAFKIWKSAYYLPF